MRGATNAGASGGGLKILASASIILQDDEVKSRIALPAGVKVLLIIASGNLTGWVWDNGECPMTMLIQSLVTGARAGNIGVRTRDQLRTFDAMNFDKINEQEFVYVALG